MRMLVPLLLLLTLVACGDLTPCHPEMVRYQRPDVCKGLNALFGAPREVVPGYNP